MRRNLQNEDAVQSWRDVEMHERRQSQFSMLQISMCISLVGAACEYESLPTEKSSSAVQQTDRKSPNSGCNAKCVCRNQGGLWCKGTCVDPATDSDHCGGCNQTCSGTCEAGQCFESPPEETFVTGISAAVSPLDGTAFASYISGSGLSVIRCSDATCSTRTVSHLEAPAVASQSTSIAVRSDGLPVIAFLEPGADSEQGTITLAYCMDASCSTASFVATEVASGGSAIYSVSLALLDDDRPAIVFLGEVVQLRYMLCADVSCTTWSTATIDPGYSAEPSLAIGTDNLPIVGYVGVTGASPVNVSELRVAHCTDVSCSDATISILDPGIEKRMPDLVIDPVGLPIIAYQYLDQLRVAHCATNICGAAAISIVDTGGVGPDPHVAIGEDTFPFISYVDGANNQFKVAHCLDPSCAVANTHTLPVDGEPFFRRDNDVVMTERADDDLLGLVFFREGVENSTSLRVGTFACDNPNCD